MDLIRLYYSENCIKPKLLLSHFFRSIGFYVEEISGQAQTSNADSIAEIYIVGLDFLQEYGRFINVKSREKTVLVCFDGIIVEDDLHVIDYQNKNDLQLLYDVIHALNTILQSDNYSPENHIYSACNRWNDLVEQVARFYIKNQLMSVIRYSHYFYGEKRLFNRIYKAYKQYILDLQSLEEFLEEDLLRYMILYANFELSFLCKKNHYIPETDSKELIIACENLMKKYITNEELHLMLADIRMELENDWLQALEDYQFEGLRHCRYAYLKCGRIVRLYLKEYESAINILNRALEFKSDYYEAEYQLAECYEALGLYTRALTIYENIVKQFNKKISAHMMSPLELEYMYKAMIKIASISKNHILDSLTANEYAKKSEQLKKEIYNHKYLRLVWPGVEKDEEMVSAIENVMADRMKVQWDKLY